MLQVNLEYLQAGSHSFIVDEPHALETFYGTPSEEGQHTPAAIRRTAARLATVFATMKACSQISSLIIHTVSDNCQTIRVFICHNEGVLLVDHAHCV